MNQVFSRYDILTPGDTDKPSFYCLQNFQSTATYRWQGDNPCDPWDGASDFNLERRWCFHINNRVNGENNVDKIQRWNVLPWIKSAHNCLSCLCFGLTSCSLNRPSCSTLAMKILKSNTESFCPQSIASSIGVFCLCLCVFDDGKISIFSSSFSTKECVEPFSPDQ